MPYAAYPRKCKIADAHGGDFISRYRPHFRNAPYAPAQRKMARPVCASDSYMDLATRFRFPFRLRDVTRLAPRASRCGCVARLTTITVKYPYTKLIINNYLRVCLCVLCAFWRIKCRTRRRHRRHRRGRTSIQQRLVRADRRESCHSRQNSMCCMEPVIRVILGLIAR